MNVGEKIKALRIQCNLTQEELAAAAGTTKQTIHKYETGIISNIPASKIKAMADKLSTTPTYLMGWEDDITYLDDIEANEIIGRINDRAKEKDLDVEEVLSACNIEINSFVSFSKKAVSLADCLDCTVDYIVGRSDEVNTPKLSDGEVTIDELLNTVGSKALIKELLKREED